MALLSAAQCYGELLSSSAHTTDKVARASRPHLNFAGRDGSSPALALVGFGTPASRRTTKPQSPHLPDSVSASSLSAPSLVLPHLSHHLPSAAADDDTPHPPPLLSSPSPTHAHQRSPPTTICSITNPEAVAGHVLRPSP